MKAIYLRKWLKGLRSGAYARGTGQLVIQAGNPDDNGNTSKDDRFCCLGVLADVLGYEIDAEGLKGDYMDWDGALPPKIANKVGLTHEHQDLLGQLNDSGETTVWINDKTGEIQQYMDGSPGWTKIIFKAKSFKGIAQVIERLFV